MEDGWNAKSCLSKEWGNLDLNLTEAGNGVQQCPPIWDGFSCWAPAPAGTTASARCPSFKGSDITKSAFRICSSSGEWLDRDGVPSPTGWTNYTPCLTPEIREIMRRLGSNDDAQIKFNIAANTRILEFVGLSLSLAALLLSLLIFYYFRTLRNSRTRLHRHLFIAMVIQVGIRLIVYTDQAITRSFESDGSTNGSASASSYHSRGAAGDSAASQRRGIDNTPILCEASYISLEYARTAMFMWMFVEGLFLHNMITVTVFEEKLSPLVYPIIGWIIPIPLTVAWAVVTHLHYGTATCWWGYNFTSIYYIIEGPRISILIVNLAFLLNILRVLVMKLRQSNSSEMQQAMKAVKAALVLLPLLGLTNLLNMLDAPLEKSPLQFALWSYSTHLLTSTQGFILAFLYCFRNGEVQMAVRKFVRIRLLGNSKHIILAKKPIPLSALDNGSLFNAIDESQGASCSQTVNMINPTTIHGSPLMITNCGDDIIRTTENSSGVSRSNYSMHQSNYYLNNNRKGNNGKKKGCKSIFSSKSAFSSPIGSVVGYGSAPPPPLIVRSFSNGILKQTSIRTDRGDSQQHHQNQHRQQLQQQQQRRTHHNKHKNHQLHHKNSENERLLQRNSSCCSDDLKGTRHVLQQLENNTLDDPTTTTTTTVSAIQLQEPPIPIPITTPMTSSSSWSSSSSSPSRGNKEAHLSTPTTLELEPQQHYQNQENFNNQRNIVANNSVRMLIIPEQLLKRKNQTAEDGDVQTFKSSPQPQMTVQLSSSASPPGRKMMMMMKSKQKKDTLRGAVSVGVISHESEDRVEEHGPGNGEQARSPSSLGGSVEEASPDYLSIDMSQEGDLEVEHVEVVVMDNKPRNMNSSLPTLNIVGINNNGKSKIIADEVNDDDDGDDERTVQIALEILKI